MPKSVRVVLWTLGIVFILWILFILSLPYTLRTESGKKVVLAVISKGLNGTLTIDKIDLSWSGTQSVEGVRFSDNQGENRFSLESFSSDQSLLSIIFKKNLGKAHIQKPSVIVGTLPQMLEEGKATTALPGDCKKHSKKVGAHIWLPFYGDIKIEEGAFLLQGATFQPISVSDLSLDIEANKGANQSFVHIQGQTQQGGQEGKILANAVVDGQVDLTIALGGGEFVSLQEGEKIVLQTQLTKVPMPLLDQLFGFDGSMTLSTAFGPTLDLNTDIEILPNSLLVNAHVDTTNLKGTFAGKSTDGEFALESPSEFNFMATQKFFEVLVCHLPQGDKWHISKPAKLTMTINALSFPLSRQAKKMGDVLLDVTIDMPQAELFHESGGSYTIRDLSATASASTLNAPIRLVYNGTIQGPEGEGSIKGSIEMNHFFIKDGQLDTSKGISSFIFEDVMIPLSFIELLLGDSQDLSAFMGSDLSLTGKASFEKGVFGFDGAASSSRFRTGRIFLKIDDTITLLQPSLITYTVTSELLAALNIDPNNLRIPEGGVMHLSLDRLSIPINDEFSAMDLFSRKGFAVNLTFSMDSLFLVSTPILDSIWIKDFHGKLDSHSPKIINISLFADVDLEQIPKGEVFLPELIGPASHIELRFDIISGMKGPYISNSSFSLESDRVSASVQGNVSSEGVFSLNKPADITFLVSPHRLREWPFNRDETILVNESALKLTLSKLNFSLFPFALDSFVTKGSGTISQIELTQEKHQGTALLQGIKLKFSLDAPGNTSEFVAKGDSNTLTRNEQRGRRGDFILAGSCTSFFEEGALKLKQADTILSFVANNFPVPFFDSWGEYEGHLVTLFGPTFNTDLRFETHPNSDKKVIVDLTASSEGFYASLGFSINKNFELLDESSSLIQWEITPTRYHTLLHLIRNEGEFPRSDYLLVNTTLVELSIEELTCPIPPPATVKEVLCQSGASAKLQIGPMNLVNQVTRSQVFIQKTLGQIRGSDFSKAITLNLEGKIQSSDEASSFSLMANVMNMMTPQGQWTPKEATIQTELNVENLDVETLSEILPMEQETRTDLLALFGQKINGNLSAQLIDLTGPISVEIESPQFKASLPLYLDQGTLFFRDEAKASVRLSEKLGQTLLKDVSPLLITAASSKDPIHIYVDPNNAVIPLNPFSLKEVRIEKAVLDLGKIEVINGGKLQELLDFLKVKEVSEEGKMEAWFTPMFLSIENGVLTCQRFDILLGKNVHIASWGTVNLLNDKVRMILGITPETMQKKFGIIGLTKKDMFQIKMRGTIDDVTLDWSNAYTRVGIIITRTAGGGPGFILGGLVELIGSTLGEEPTPPPTTSPFPWEQEQQNTPSDQIPQQIQSQPNTSSKNG